MARNEWSSSPDRSRWDDDDRRRAGELDRQDRYQGNAFAWQRGRGPGQGLGHGAAGWTGGQGSSSYGGGGDYGWGWGDERGGYGLYPSAETGSFDRGYGRDPSFGPGMAWRQRPGDYARDWHGWGAGRGMGLGGGRDAGRGGGSGAWDNDRGFLERAGDEVASWFGDEDARRRREQDYRGVGPRGYQRSDDRISEDVCDRLSDDPTIDASGIDVSVEGGEVTLNGEVPSRQAKRAAEDCCERISGVAHVQNNLRVKTTTAGGASTASGGTAGALVSPRSTPV